MLRIHPTAIIENGAEIGEETEIGPYSVIGPAVKVGRKCQIGPHVVITGHTTLGEENKVFQFASIGSPPQDLKYKGEPSTLIIGSRNTIREYVTLQPGTAHASMTTIIGDNNLFMVNSHVAHDCTVGNNNVFANSVALAGHVDIGNNVILGGLVGVHQHCRVGDYSMLGGGAMIAADVPPYCIGQGDRCHLRGINLIALKRVGITPSDIAEVKRAYRLLFVTSGHLQEKISKFPKELAERPLIKVLIDFISSSKRGVCLPAKTITLDSDPEQAL